MRLQQIVLFHRRRQQRRLVVVGEVGAEPVGLPVDHAPSLTVARKAVDEALEKTLELLVRECGQRSSVGPVSGLGVLSKAASEISNRERSGERQMEMPFRSV